MPFENQGSKEDVLISCRDIISPIEFSKRMWDTMTEYTKLFLQVCIALCCVVFVFQFISFKRDHNYRLREWRKNQSELLNDNINTADNMPLSPTYSNDEMLKRVKGILEQGFTVGLDTCVIAKYPQIMSNFYKSEVLVTDEILQNVNINKKVVGLKPFTDIRPVKEFVKKIGLDSGNITDCAIGSYLYFEKTNLVNIVFVTLDKSAFEKAQLVGLRAKVL